VKSDMVRPFLRARHGWAEPQYLHPDLEPVLKPTFGVVVFHEQVIDMLHVITGCSRAEGDEKRRALGDPDGQAETREWFYRRASARGYDLPTIERIWDVLHAFASFGFCKAHAAAFALPTYQSAWLKAHHTAGFLAGVLTHDPGMYPKRLILDDARQFGITVLSVDVNTSQAGYRVERVQGLDADASRAPHRVAPRTDPALSRRRGVLDQPQLPDARGYGIRIALSEVKGISDAEVDRVIAGQPYQSLTDFWHRAAISRPVVERLVLAGAFDALHAIDLSLPTASARRRITRRDLLLQVAELDRWTAMPTARRSRTPNRDAIDTQLSFPLGPSDEQLVPSGLPEMTGAEQVRAELDVLGLDASRHVIDFYTPLLRALDVVRSRDLLTCRSRSEILVAGVKVATQTPPIRSGRRVVFVTLDDATGPVDATFFEDAQGPYAATLFHSWLLVIRGEVRRTGPRGISLRATGCWELSSLHDLWQRNGVESVHDLIDTPPPGFGPDDVLAPAGVAQEEQPSGYSAGGMGRRRVLVHPSGFKQSPYADVKPAGDDVNQGAPPRKLWHSSPGSSGQ
ncbi:MAG TPA: OB-fold nucleic acid binding domain-containing protein, partial [Actinomycetes bacterium]|nr:OB-fold nucleic acid binding domain-containing protein [Actinomycetes bacterium]